MAAEAPTPPPPAPAPADTTATVAPIFEGYTAFFLTMPSRLFSQEDARPKTKTGLGEPAGDFWKWTTGRRAHVLELRGDDDMETVIDGRWIRSSKALRFEGEPGIPALGTSAKVYANDQAICIEGVPAAASGTAGRHVRVTLITQPYGPRARRIVPPSLFAGCLSLTREPDGSIGFFKASYRWPEGRPEPLGLTLERWRLKGTTFVPVGDSRTLTFVESGNVYRFTSP